MSMTTELRWVNVADASNDPKLWVKDNGVYKNSIPLLVRNAAGQVKVTSLMWVYNSQQTPSMNGIGLFADSFGPVWYAKLDGLKY